MCKIVNYFFIADLLLAGGANCSWKGLQKEAMGWGQEGWGKGGRIRGVGQGGKEGWNLY